MKQRYVQVFDVEASSCLRVSAKTGQGLNEVVSAIIDRVPPPAGDTKGKLRMLLFDAVHDEYRHGSADFGTLSHCPSQP